MVFDRYGSFPYSLPRPIRASGQVYIRACRRTASQAAVVPSRAQTFLLKSKIAQMCVVCSWRLTNSKPGYGMENNLPSHSTRPVGEGRPTGSPD